MPAAKWKQKDPADIADYWFDWGADTGDEEMLPFLPAEETIVDHTVTVPAGLTKIADSHADKTVRIRVSGGTAGVDYPITCLIETSTGQEFESTKTLKVRERTDVPA